MPLSIPIVAVPNQKLSAVLDGFRYVLTLRTITPTGITICDIARNGVTIVSGARVVANRLIMQHRYQEGAGGNFFIQTGNADDDLPDYTQFGTTQLLVYMSAADLAAGRV